MAPNALERRTWVRSAISPALSSNNSGLSISYQISEGLDVSFKTLLEKLRMPIPPKVIDIGQRHRRRDERFACELVIGEVTAMFIDL